jgi:hypothetical protein
MNNIKPQFSETQIIWYCLPSIFSLWFSLPMRCQEAEQPNLGNILAPQKKLDKKKTSPKICQELPPLKTDMCCTHLTRSGMAEVSSFCKCSSVDYTSGCHKNTICYLNTNCYTNNWGQLIRWLADWKSGSVNCRSNGQHLPGEWWRMFPVTQRSGYLNPPLSHFKMLHTR